MGLVVMFGRLRFSRRTHERAFGLVYETATRADHDRAQCRAHFHPRAVSLSTRGKAFPPCGGAVRDQSGWKFPRASGQKIGRQRGHLAVIATGSFWPTISLPTFEQRDLDVGHKYGQSALHEIVRVSSARVSP